MQPPNRPGRVLPKYAKALPPPLHPSQPYTMTKNGDSTPRHILPNTLRRCDDPHRHHKYEMTPSGSSVCYKHFLGPTQITAAGE